MSRLPVLALILIVLGAPGCLTRTVVVRSRDAGCSGPVQATLEPQEVLAAVAAPDGSIYLDVQYDHERVERVVLRPFGPSLEPLDLAVGRLAEEVAARLASLRAKPAAEPAATHWAELAPPEPLPPGRELTVATSNDDVTPGALRVSHGAVALGDAGDRRRVLAQLPAPSAWVEQRPEPARKLGWAALAPIALVADLTLVGGFLGWLFFDYRGRAR